MKNKTIWIILGVIVALWFIGYVFKVGIFAGAAYATQGTQGPCATGLTLKTMSDGKTTYCG